MQIGKYLENILEKYVKIMTDAKEGNLWCQINFQPQSFYQSKKNMKGQSRTPYLVYKSA